MINSTAISKWTTGEAMHAVVNQNTTDQGITFLGCLCFEGETVQLETNRHTSAEEASLRLEIISNLHLMVITPSNGYASICWSQWVIANFVAEVGLTDYHGVSNLVAEEFFQVVVVSPRLSHHMDEQRSKTIQDPAEFRAPLEHPVHL